MLEQFYKFKIIITLAPTCFGSRRNHPQRAVLYFAKTTNMVYLCSSVQMQSMFISACCSGVRLCAGEKFERYLADLKQRIIEAVDLITLHMLINTWQELEYHLDICRATTGAHMKCTDVHKNLSELLCTLLKT